MTAAGDQPVILLVVDDPGRAAALREALQPHRVVTVGDARSALARLDQHVFLVLADSTLPDATGLAFLQQCAAAQPAATRVLLAEYEELPDIVRARAAGVVHHVVPRTVPRRKLARIADDALGFASEPSLTGAPPTATQAGRGQGAALLLTWTVEQLLRVPGVVIRDLPRDPRALHLQFVVPRAEVATLQARLARGWPERVKAAGERLAFRLRRHPVNRFLGGLTTDSELHVLQRGDGGHAFIALLPWRREPRVTALLGILPGREDHERETLRDLVTGLHRIAVRTVPEFSIPHLDDDEETTGAGQPVLEYDWVVTDDYAGIDRRQRPTSFFNRFIFVGRRRRIPSRHRAVADGFVDRLPRRVWLYALAYAVLSLVDTGLTFHFVRAGTVVELNPLLRPLLGEPALFLVAKNALALAGTLVVARLHLWRVGEHLLRLTLLAWLLLDGYWLWLLWNVLPGRP